MPLPPPSNPDQFRRLVDIMEALLSPEGCPWDRQQSHASLKPYVIEEAYEVCDSIDDGDFEELRGELGDLGLQIVFHAALAKREGRFTVDDVYRSICEKLIRRHPHVFAEVEANDAETVLKNWEEIKRGERAAKKGAGEKPPSALDGIPRHLPALQRAQRIQAKAARVGFDWGNVAPVFAKIHEEIDELEEAVKSIDLPAPRDGDGGEPRLSEHLPLNEQEIFNELGDLLFALVNLARFLRIDPEQALQATNRKFTARFHHIEARLTERGKTPAESTLEEMDELWEEAKRLANPLP